MVEWETGRKTWTGCAYLCFTNGVYFARIQVPSQKVIGDVHVWRVQVPCEKVLGFLVLH